MNKRALRKEFYMEIKKSFNRFASILLIVALGVAFLAGIRATQPDMHLSADIFYDASRLMDIRVLSTLGLTEEDVEEIKSIKGVEQVMPAYSIDVLCNTGASQLVVKMMSLPKTINKITVGDGRLPENSGECLADSSFLVKSGLQIGDIITVKSGNTDDIYDTLKRTDYKIVGSGITSYYMSHERGTSSVGSGELSSFMVISDTDFSMEVYTEVYITVENAREELSYTSIYDDKVEKIVERIESIADARCEVRYTDIVSEASEGIADGETEIENAENELTDAKTELEDARQELEDGKVKISNGETELVDGKKEFQDGKAELSDAEKKLLDGEIEAADGQQKLKEALIELKDGEQKILENREKLLDARVEVMANKRKLEDGRKQLEDGKKEITLKEGELLAAETQLNNAGGDIESMTSLKQSSQGLKAAIENDLATISGNSISAGTGGGIVALLSSPAIEEQLDEQSRGIVQGINAELKLAAEEGRSKLLLEGGLLQGVTALLKGLEEKANQYIYADNTIKQGKSALQAAKGEIVKNETDLKEGEDKLHQAEYDILDGEKQLKEAEAELQDGWKEYNEKSVELEDGIAELQDGKIELSDALKKLNDAQKKLGDAEKKLLDARVDLEDGEVKLKDGEKEYTAAKIKAEGELTDAKRDIEDAKQEISDLELPKWHVLDRNTIESYVSYGMDADRIAAIGKVFPIIFFLVAALVSLTTMTRMVEEERTQIGTLKALGYSNLSIASKYLMYALLASFLGSLIGLYIGQKILPSVIINAYKILYINLPVIVTPLNPFYSVTATLAAIACTVVAAMLSCYKELAATPAVLMRPQAPKAGKRVLLERIPVLWKSLGFTGKATVRNLVRYKKRFFMTVFGIGGCTALLLLGYGLKDAVGAIGSLQFNQIHTYRATLSIDKDAKQIDKEALNSAIEEDGNISGYLCGKEMAVDAFAGDKEKGAQLIVAESGEELDDFMKLRDRITKEEKNLSDTGVVITEKLAKMLGITIGDTITLEAEDNKSVEVVVDAVTENYYLHYIYMSKNLYENLYDKAFEYNTVYLDAKDDSQELEKSMGEKYVAMSAVTGIMFLSDLNRKISDMLETMDTVIYVLIVSAGLLAFVVLYNLNNINVNERKRELATLKVLGFFDGEVTAYICRENILLTLFGTIFGLVMGIVLHLYVIETVEIDTMMFGRQIYLSSFVYSVALTFAFSAIVNLVMYFKLKKIDMIESLKSVE